MGKIGCRLVALKSRGDYELAVSSFDEARIVFRSMDCDRGIAWIDHIMGNAARDRGDYEVDESFYRESARYFRLFEDEAGLSDSIASQIVFLS